MPTCGAFAGPPLQLIYWAEVGHTEHHIEAGSGLLTGLNEKSQEGFQNGLLNVMG